MQPSETDKVSIVDAIKKGNYEASIVTTYNAYLPYYEEVFLRYLHSAGCRHNVLLMDAAQFSESIGTPTLRPKSAGYSYSLIPIVSNGAFHPKLILLLSRKKGLLFVGSHNMTISGMGLNNELTTRIDVSDGKQKQGITIARDAWLFVEKWVNFNSETLPKPILDAFYALKRFAPWLNKSDETLSSELQFFGSDPSGDSLWENVYSMIDPPIRKVYAIGPFFDQKLEFINKVNSDLNPNEFLVGIEPDTVSIPDHDFEKHSIQFVDSSQLQNSSGYLHAKAMYIEAESGNTWLITGSANPSRNAWTSSSSRRNAEAVILHTGQIAINTANNLGINQIDQLPIIDDDTWVNIKERTQAQKLKNKKTDSKLKYLIGIAVDKRIQVSSGKFQQNDYVEAKCFDETGNIIETTNKYEIIDLHFCISIQDNIENIRFVELVLLDSESILCLIHHVSEITRRSVSSRQAQFRRTIASLQSDNPDLENLIKTVEKIIFEEPFEIEPSAKRKDGYKANSTESKTDQEITTLAVDLKDTKKEKKRKRLVTSGDIGHLIDVLIHHLGIGLDRESEGTDVKGRTEEELVGTDDEDNEKEPELIDMPKVVKICNGKVRRLITRMVKNFEKTAEQNQEYDLCLMKLLAVLALLRELRALDYKLQGIPFEQSLFPEKERIRLLKESLKYLYGDEYKFFDNIDIELIESPWDELSRLHGLLLWLAHDCGADFRDKKGFNESLEDRKKRFLNKSYLLLVAPQAVTDAVSFEEAKLSINRTTKKFRKPDNLEWFSVHHSLGNELNKFRKTAHIDHKRYKTIPIVGQLAFIRDLHNPTFHVVLSSGGTYVTLTDISSEDGQQLYSAKRIAAVNFP